MNKIILVIIIILVILVAGYFIYNMYQAPAYGPTLTVTGNTTNIPATTQQSVQQVSLSAPVSIKNFAFDPTPLTIKVGTTVTWTNNDPMPHQIKSATFNSAPLSSGQTFSFTFSAVGQYNYSCAIHPSMHGQIIVTE